MFVHVVQTLTSDNHGDVPKPAPSTGLERHLTRQERLALRRTGHRPSCTKLRRGASHVADNGDDVAGPETHSSSNLPRPSLQRTACSSSMSACSSSMSKRTKHLRIRSMEQATELGMRHDAGEKQYEKVPSKPNRNKYLRSEEQSIWQRYRQGGYAASDGELN